MPGNTNTTYLSSGLLLSSRSSTPCRSRGSFPTEPDHFTVELSITSRGKKRDERIRTNQRRSTFVQGDFQLSGISRWNAWKAKSRWSPIDFYEGKGDERREANGEEESKEGEGEEEATLTGQPYRSVEFLILTKHWQRAGLEEKEKEEARHPMAFALRER